MYITKKFKRSENMVEKLKIKEKAIFYIISILFSLIFLLSPLEANAGYKSGISVSVSALGFADHNGMMAKINGEYVYCFRRGYPFRTKVSELQMVYANIDGHEGTIASNIRYLLTIVDTQAKGVAVEYFRGWGTWDLNGDHTNATLTDSDGAPTSTVWQEVFDEDKEDDEDPEYESRYQGAGTEEFYFMKKYLTGHEGSLDPFVTQMKKISYDEAGLNMSQVYAFAMTNYYCWEDEDASSYSDETKYRVKQAMDWAIEYGFIKTIGGTGKSLTLIYQDSTGKYGRSGSQSYTGSCDGYINYNRRSI
jgi:hypothetical protein